MKFSKKLLSLLLAIVMVVSTLSVAAFAWTMTGDLTTGEKAMNVKYTVQKVDSTPEMADGTPSYVGDDIYAVTAWAQSSSPLAQMTATFHYNKAHYTPIMIYDGELTYPGTGENQVVDPDNYYTDMGEVTNYIYSFGSYMNDTGMYRNTGATATTVALARYIGMGNANHPGISVMTQLVSPDSPLFGRYSAGVDTDTNGIVFISIDVSAANKSAYFNTYCENKTFGINTDWVDMVTLYFQRNEGVTDADCVGDVFGNTSVGSFCMDGVLDLSGNKYCTSSTTATVPEINLVSNAVVEGEAGPSYGVEFLKDQIKFETNKDGSYAGEFAYRTIAKLTGFADAAEISANVAEAGFIFNKGALDIDAAKAQIESGSGSYSQAKSAYVSTTAVEGEFVMACVVYDIPAADVDTQLSTLAYLVLNDGTVVTFPAVNASTFSGLYNQYFSQQFPA